MTWYKHLIATGKDTAMNIDTLNYGPFRVTRHKNGTETIMDTRDGTCANMRKPLAEIVRNASSRSAILAELALQHNPCL